MTATQTKEFTLPFVGREEELKFLLDEYDQMLHAQYRSVWIEAPAGMGKTTLVEEFLKRISVGAGSPRPSPGSEKKHKVSPSKGGETPPLQPWIVHAHLRERSSNSLASFVEALGASLQTLTETQREKLFSGLTSFYQERARKIVGGGNVQSMDMEEAITTAGYILKKLSFYFPLVVIIEDIHVLKGEMSFYALRQLQAITEHVPMLAFYISRPSDEKNLIQFREQVIKEGCKKYEVKSLKYEDVETLVGTRGVRPCLDVKKLMHLSGGNALLLRELIRSEITDAGDVAGSTSEIIIHYLTKELERLPKRDRQVVAIAGMLGEEFSEQLLQEVTENKNFKCWSNDVLSRLEKKGIVRRRRKILKPEGEGKEISLRVSVFTHALWWEGARKLYVRKNNRANKKFAEAIVPLLSHEDYPLLTDAELIVNLFRWSSQKMLRPLLIYIQNLCGFGAPWEFHSHEERIAILSQAHKTIMTLIRSKSFRLDNPINDAMVRLLNAEQLVMAFKGSLSSVYVNNNLIIRKLLSRFSKRDLSAFKLEGLMLFDEAETRFFHDYDINLLRKILQSVRSLEKRSPPVDAGDASRFISALCNGVLAFQHFFENPRKAGEHFYQGAKTFRWDVGMEGTLASSCLSKISSLPIPQNEVARAFSVAQKLRQEITQATALRSRVRMVYSAEVVLALRAGLVDQAASVVGELKELLSRSIHINDRFVLSSLLVSIYSYQGEEDQALPLLKETLSDEYSWIDEEKHLHAFARSLFLLEQFEVFEKLWARLKNNFSSNRIHFLISTLKIQVSISLLTKNEEGQKEALEKLEYLSRKYSVSQESIRTTMTTLSMFLVLKGKSLKQAKRRFQQYLNDDDTLSPFDKAHQAQLFARIGVQYGHPPKEFTSFIKQSLDGFAKLGLPRRVVFTAKKFAEVNLLSKKELIQIIRKYGDDEPTQKSESEHPVQQEQVPGSSPQSSNEVKGVTLYCLGQLIAVRPNGEELESKRWGKRNAVYSNYRKIVVELVRAKLEHRSATRREFLVAIYPEVRDGLLSDKKIFTLDRKLSVYLSQLKGMFSPDEIIERTSEGYRLHPSVSVDILEMKQLLTLAKTVAHRHLPSVLWLCSKAQSMLQRGEFAQGSSEKKVMNLRKEFADTQKAAIRLLAEAGKNIML